MPVPAPVTIAAFAIRSSSLPAPPISVVQTGLPSGGKAGDRTPLTKLLPTRRCKTDALHTARHASRVRSTTSGRPCRRAAGLGFQRFVRLAGVAVELSGDQAGIGAN